MTSGNVICIVLMLSAEYPGFASVSESQPRGCLCPDETLEFECTIEGGGTTVWEGTLLTCPPSDSIQIDRDSFEPVERSVSYTCHNQSINATVWYRQEGENNYYSRLSVSRILLPNLSGSTVKCTYDDGSHEIDVRTWTVIDPLSPPTNIYLQHANTTHLNFSWDEVIFFCSSLQYDIHTINCGTCPSISTLPFFVCENVDITTDTRVCSVAVQARCGNTAGNMSDIFQVPLKVLKSPDVTSIPTYSNGTKRMLGLNVTLDVVQIDMNEGSDTFYTIQLLHATSNISCGSQQISSSSCQHGVCSHQFDISTSQCASSDILVTTFATNRFGDGPKSKSILGGQDTLVNIDFDHTRQAFLCNFLNATTNRIKSCIVNVTHGNNCDNHVGIYSGIGLGDSIAVEALNLTGNISDYCFMITAQSGTTTVAILVTEVSVPPQGLSQIVLPVSIEVIFTIVAASVVALAIPAFCITCYYIRRRIANGLDFCPLRTIEFSVTNEFGALERALAVFKRLGIGVRFITTCTPMENETRTFQVTYKFSRTHNNDLITQLQDNNDNGGGVITARAIPEDAPVQRVVLAFSVRDETGELLKVMRLLKRYEINIDNLDGGEYCYEDNTRRFTVEWYCHENAKRSLFEALRNDRSVINPQEGPVNRRNIHDNQQGNN